MRRKVLGVALVLLCSLAFVASSAEAGGYEVWLVRQRVRWTSNDGYRSRATYDGELRVTVSGGIAKDFSILGGWGWDGDFTAPDQVWRDTTIKRHYLVFSANDGWMAEVAGWFRPNRKWTKLSGKFTGTEWDLFDPGLSWYIEARVTATYSHWVP